MSAVRRDIFVERLIKELKLRRSDISVDLKMPPLRGLNSFGAGFYKDAAPTALVVTAFFIVQPVYWLLTRSISYGKENAR